MDERNSTISLEQARNGSPVPVINGVYLHSIYDPEKEAEAFVETFTAQLQQKKNVLILGLGLGYHIEKVASFLKDHHGDFNITVLETNSELISLCEKHFQFDKERISIIQLEEYKTLYSQRSFVDFLMRKPCLLKHEASFALNKESYTGFLKHKPSRQVASYEEQLSETTRDLISLNSHSTLREVSDNIKNSGRIEGRMDFLAMALGEIIKPNQEEL